MRTRPEPEGKRFMRSLVIEAETGCWVWQGRPGSSGYGQFKVGGRGGRNWMSHHYAADRWGPARPSGTQWLHGLNALGVRCPKLCVNPWHGRWGTSVENHADINADGRRRNQWSSR